MANLDAQESNGIFEDATPNPGGVLGGFPAGESALGNASGLDPIITLTAPAEGLLPELDNGFVFDITNLELAPSGLTVWVEYSNNDNRGIRNEMAFVLPDGATGFNNNWNAYWYTNPDQSIHLELARLLGQAPTTLMNIYVEVVAATGNVTRQMFQFQCLGDRFTFQSSSPINTEIDAGSTIQLEVDWEPGAETDPYWLRNVHLEVVGDDGVSEAAYIEDGYTTPGTRNLAHFPDLDPDLYPSIPVQHYSGQFIIDVRREPGWRTAAFTFRLSGIDRDGVPFLGEFPFTCGNPIPDEPPADETLPEVTDISPAAGTAISRDQPVFLTMSDDVALRRALLIAKFSTSWEVVHDGTSFSPAYSGSSTRTELEAGKSYRYRVRRNAGWPEAPTLLPIPIDTAGNESS